MLPLQNRLKKREDFAQVFSKGAYAGYGGLSIKYGKNTFSESRIGFPIGKAFSKKATIRNRTRRILREAAMQCLKDVRPGYDIIILIKPDYQNIELMKVVTELKKIMLKANLII